MQELLKQGYFMLENGNYSRNKPVKVVNDIKTENQDKSETIKVGKKRSKEPLELKGETKRLKK